MIATAMPAAIKPYSIAVAPLSFRMNRLNPSAMVTFLIAFFHVATPGAYVNLLAAL
jgi:hypothetical protein